MESGTKIKLRFPVSRPDGTGVSELTLRPITGKDMMDMTLSSDMKMSEIILLASKLSGEHLPVFHSMRAPDVLEVVKVVGDFLGSGQKTTKK